MRSRIVLAAALSVRLLVLPDAGHGATPEKPVRFAARNGQTTEAFTGEFEVPENRADPRSRMLTLHYVRFPSTSAAPAAPIVYLAGGPGGSGIDTARDRRFDQFMQMRASGDVIALDQRGTGASNDVPACISSQTVPASAPMTDAQDVAIRKAALLECLDFWRARKIDIYGYTTLESVADLDALRIHLGVPRISLWAISYGTHLALAAIKQMDDRLDKVVLASVEGLDQTIKLPERTNAYFSRLQLAIDTQAGARRALPDIVGMIRRVHEQLDRQPLRLTLRKSAAEHGRTVIFQRRDMQQLAAAMIADPPSAVNLLGLYAALDHGDIAPLVDVVTRHFDPDKPLTYPMMPWMMDLASATDARRRQLILTQAQSALLGVYLNDTLNFEGVVPGLDLGGDFRKRPTSAIPVLMLSGTLDGRTYIESQHEAVVGLERRQFVTVRNAGHNLFESAPEVMHTIVEFMEGSQVDGREITVPLPDFWPWEKQ